MYQLTIKKSFLLVVWFWTTTLPWGLTFDLYDFDEADQCNITIHGGLYGRDFDRCCKGEHLTDNYIFSNDYDCRVKVPVENPNDDLSTSMWRIEACELKEAMGLAENEINFKSYVEFMTRNYTVDNNVQQLIRNANKDCKDADEEKEFHKKIEAFTNCFYANEEKVCDSPTPEGLKTKEDINSRYRNVSINARKKCKPIPGVWDDPYFCCNGKETPKSWKHLSRYTNYGETETSFQKCAECIKQEAIVKPTEALYSSLNDETTKDMQKYIFNQLDLYDCYDACTINPINFQNESTVTFDTNGVLNQSFSKLPAAVRKDLKEISLRHIKDLKVAVSVDNLRNKTGITMDEIANQYPTLKDESTRALYYCAYYRRLVLLSRTSLLEYCISEESLTNYIDKGYYH